MARKYKILMQKTATGNEYGSESKLYEANDILECNAVWEQSLMDTFVENGWAMEVKVDSVEKTVQVEAEIKEVKRARNEKGHLVGDDESTPDVNEAWEGGEAPVKKTTKTTKTKKTTKKKS